MRTVPFTRGMRVRWESVLSNAIVVSVRPRTWTAKVSPDYSPNELVDVDIDELERLDYQ